MTKTHVRRPILSALSALSALLGLCAPILAQTLPTGVTVVPFYDTSKAGLSFAKDKQSVIGMYEVPGKPQHFLVLGYWGFVWSLYPDTTKTYASGAIKDYAKKQLANFNNVVMKGWEQGALGAAFDPAFAENRSFYIIYNKYPDAANYHEGFKPGTGDGPGSPGLVVVERWKLSADYAALTRDTTILAADHGTGYGSSNMVFGKDGLLYITTDSYSKNSWDSTTLMRKILRIDVSKQDAGKMYSIPPGNPFFNAANPAVRKEIFAFGFRNTYSLVADYITGKIWGAEVGQTTWEEINIIQAGKNYGWADGGDGQSSSYGVGIEGPCTKIAGDGGAYNGGFKNPYSFQGAQSQNRKYTCADFTNGTWNFSHPGATLNGTPTAVPNLEMSCIILSQAFRGDPSSPFYGYHFVTDVARNYFVAIKEGVASAQNVGKVPATMEFTGDLDHNGITSFSEDAYGNFYVTLVSSSSTGAFAWHDIYRMSHSQLIPLSAPRNQVVPTSIRSPSAESVGYGRFQNRVLDGFSSPWVRLPEGFTRVELYALNGTRLWVSRGEAGASLRLPRETFHGAVRVRFLP